MGEKEKIDPRVRDVLKLLAVGTIILVTVLFPGIAGASVFIKDYQRKKWERDKKEWEKFNLWRLRQVIKRLQGQKMVDISGGEVKITEKGRQKLLKFNLEEMELTRKTDGKWRLIVYDVSNLKKQQRDMFRRALKKLRILQIQKSVYLTPFVCDDEIEYLRQTFNIGKDVLILRVSGIENAYVYKKYFGLT